MPTLTAKQAKFVANGVLDEDADMVSNQVLSARQQRYVDAYEGNATQAAIKAGYSASSARQSAARLMTNAAISGAIDARRTRDSQRVSLTRQRAIAGLLEAIEQAKLAGAPSAVIAGWREVGRMMGFYEPETRRVEVSSSSATAARGKLEAMSDEELMAIIAGGGGGPT